jgi:transposase-like protein
VPGASVARVARTNGINTNQLFTDGTSTCPAGWVRRRGVRSSCRLRCNQQRVQLRQRTQEDSHHLVQAQIQIEGSADLVSRIPDATGLPFTIWPGRE